MEKSEHVMKQQELESFYRYNTNWWYNEAMVICVLVDSSTCYGGQRAKNLVK